MSYYDPEGTFWIPLVLGVIVYEAAFDFTTFGVELFNTKSFTSAKNAMLERSPLFKKVGDTALKMTVGKVALPAYKALLDPVNS